MKRWLVTLFICSYLSCLGYGIFCHTLSVNTAKHPGMYFVIWDMFCGWSAYANRLHVVGEGVSGKFYEIAPAPWGEIIPYRAEGRLQYDTVTLHTARLVQNTLVHTDHEPITRIFVIEESWSKKFDLPDAIWNARYGKPKHRQTYFRIRQEMAGDAQLIRSNSTWLDNQAAICLGDNPRLSADSRNGQPFFVIDQVRHNGSGYFTPPESPTFAPVSAPLGH